MQYFVKCYISSIGILYAGSVLVMCKDFLCPWQTLMYIYLPRLAIVLVFSSSITDFPDNVQP